MGQQSNNGTNRGTLILAAANIVLVLVIAVQVYLQNLALNSSIEQVNVLKDEVKALQEQVSISRQQFESMTRPWVGVKEAHFHEIRCATDGIFVHPLTREAIDNPNPVSGYQNVNQYTFRNKCLELVTIFDVTVRNYGSIPAESIQIAYLMTDNRAPDWNGSNFSKFDLAVSSMPQYKKVTLMPQQETTIQLNQTVAIPGFPFLDVRELKEYETVKILRIASGHLGPSRTCF